MKKLVPEKIFYKIGEVANLTGLQPYVLRYWEGEFNFKLTKSKNHQRLYQKRDIEQIQRIKRLLYEEKYTIAGAKKKLRERKKKGDGDQIPLVLPLPNRDRQEIVEKLKEMKREIRTFLDELGPPR